jgi:uncharacterized protein
MRVSLVVSPAFAARAGFLVIAGAIALYSACAGEPPRAPPAISPAEYQQETEAWRAQRMTALSNGLRLLGIWELPEGDTPFGGDSTLPIVLPRDDVPARAGLVRKQGARVYIIRERGFVDGSLRFDVVSDERAGALSRWLTVSDDADSAIEGIQPFETFPVSMTWRVAAMFREFSAPKSFHVANMVGGTNEVLAPGELVFRAGGREFRLSAMRSVLQGRLYVMFRDETSGVSTYGGFRTLDVQAVPDGRWTVLDFNRAENPPCSYSKLLACPLPPIENRIAVPVEAGEKIPPTSRGSTSVP